MGWKMNNNMLPRVCRECGVTFPGGPRAWYCPNCREERKKEQWRSCQRRKKAGAVVPIGSVIKCESCGKEIVKNGSLQRFCNDCAKIHLKEIDNAQSLAWKRENPEKIKKAKHDMTKRRSAEEGKSSGCTGVSWDKTKRAWIASIGYHGKQYRLVKTKDLDAATKARKEAEEAVKNGDFEKWINKPKTE